MRVLEIEINPIFTELKFQGVTSHTLYETESWEYVIPDQEIPTKMIDAKIGQALLFIHFEDSRLYVTDAFGHAGIYQVTLIMEMDDGTRMIVPFTITILPECAATVLDEIPLQAIPVENGSAEYHFTLPGDSVSKQNGGDGYSTCGPRSAVLDTVDPVISLKGNSIVVNGELSKSTVTGNLIFCLDDNPNICTQGGLFFFDTALFPLP